MLTLFTENSGAISDVPISNEPDRAGQLASLERPEENWWAPKARKQRQLKPQTAPPPRNEVNTSHFSLSHWHGSRTQLVSPALNGEDDQALPSLFAGLPDRTPKKRKAKEPPLSTDDGEHDPNLGSRLEHAVDRHQLPRFSKTPLKENSAIEGAKGPNTASAHITAIKSDKGSIAAGSGIEGVKGLSPARKSDKSSISGIESVKGSSPVVKGSTSSVPSGLVPNGEVVINC